MWCLVIVFRVCVLKHEFTDVFGRVVGVQFNIVSLKKGTFCAKKIPEFIFLMSLIILCPSEVEQICSTIRIHLVK